MSRMAVRTLVRMPFLDKETFSEVQDIDNVSKLDRELAVEANEQLGYKGIVVDIKEKRRELEKAQNLMKLRLVLQSVEASPFTERSVEKYKEKMVRFDKFRAHSPQVILFLTSFVIATSLINYLDPRMPLLIRDALGTLLSMVVILLFNLPFFSGYSRGDWCKFSIRTYTQPIPKSVLVQAMEIKKQLPSAEFYIHEFSRNRVVIDPFISVCYGDNELYFAVWDEPSFEAEREV